MSDFELGADGDLIVRSGQFPLLRGRDAVAQSLLTRLRSIRGEWDQDRSAGVPYYEDVFGKPDEQVLRALFSPIILETPGVKQIVSLTFSEDEVERQLFLDGEVITVDDDTIVLKHVELVVR